MRTKKLDISHKSRTRLDQLLCDANARIRRTHQLMDRTSAYLGENNGGSKLDTEDGWQFSN